MGELEGVEFLWPCLGIGPSRGPGSIVLSLEVFLIQEEGPVWAGDSVCGLGDQLLILFGCSQQDAQEFLKLLMERLHLEINRRGRRAPPILASSPAPSPPLCGGALLEEPDLR